VRSSVAIVAWSFSGFISNFSLAFHLMTSMTFLPPDAASSKLCKDRDHYYQTSLQANQYKILERMALKQHLSLRLPYFEANLAYSRLFGGKKYVGISHIAKRYKHL